MHTYHSLVTDHLNHILGNGGTVSTDARGIKIVTKHATGFTYYLIERDGRLMRRDMDSNGRMMGEFAYYMESDKLTMYSTDEELNHVKSN